MGGGPRFFVFLDAADRGGDWAVLDTWNLVGIIRKQ